MSAPDLDPADCERESYTCRNCGRGLAHDEPCPPFRCGATTTGLDGETLTCTLPSGHDKHHSDEIGGWDWLTVTAKLRPGAGVSVGDVVKVVFPEPK